MTDKERREEVRIKMAEIVGRYHSDAEMAVASKSKYYPSITETLNEILLLKDTDGKPMLGIISDDQTAPSYKDYYSLTTFSPRYQQARRAAWDKGQLQMRTSNFKRIIKERDIGS